MERLYLYQWTWGEVQAYLKKDSVILLPFGSTEQHGLHAPLGNDALVAIRLAEDAARATKTLVAPPCWYGWAPHHMAYPGTISIMPETLIRLCYEILRNLIYHGFKRLIVINGHRKANLPPLEIAVSRIRNETGAYVCIADPFFIGETASRKIKESPIGGIGHAEELETSHMLYIYPELMNMKKAVKNLPKKKKFHMMDPYWDADRISIPSTLEGFRKATEPSGVAGDPTLATKAKGKYLHEALVNNLVELIKMARKEKVTLKKTTPVF
ncbi:MAG: creatininase family protein [Deltaproteobacteria bacterium]|nr:creatininase family protein [Deltaproteobacteria bacterium]